MACWAARPIVDGLERQYADRLLVLRLNIQEHPGRELSRKYGSFATPTFIFFDAGGDEQLRQVGSLDLRRIEALLEP